MRRRGPRRCRRPGCSSRRSSRSRSRREHHGRDRSDRDGGRALPAARAASARRGRRRSSRGCARSRAALPSRRGGRARRSPFAGSRGRRRRPARLGRAAALPSCRLRLCANRALLERGAQLARRGRRVLGVADCSHHDDPRSAGLGHLSHVTEVDSADREPGRGRRRASAAWRTYESPAAGRPAFVGVSHTGPTLSWSATPDASARRAAPASASRARPARRRPRARAPRAAGMSSCPTCTPSAPHASTRSGRSFSQNSAPCSSHSRRNTAAARTSSSSLACLVAELDHVHPAGERRREQLLEPGPYIGDEVQPRAREPLAAGIHYGLNVARGERLRTVLYAGRAVPSTRSSPASNRLSLGDCCQW